MVERCCARRLSLFRASARPVDCMNCTCGSRTAGEVLFFTRVKKSTQKKARPRGCATSLATAGQIAPELATRYVPVLVASARLLRAPFGSADDLAHRVERFARGRTRTKTHS